MINNLIKNKRVSALFKGAILSTAKLQGLTNTSKNTSGVVDGEEEADFSIDVTNVLEKIATDNPEELKKLLNDHSDLNETEKTKLMNDLAKSLKLKTQKSLILDKSGFSKDGNDPKK
jgi:hypothetical protein